MRTKAPQHNNSDPRRGLLADWARSVTGALGRGLVGEPVRVHAVDAIAGPRAGALELDAGLAAGRVLSGLGKDDAALTRQLIPWRFEGQPAVYLARRYVRIEAGWPGTLAEDDITLTSLGQFPTGGGRWIAGKNESGATVTLAIDDTKPHWLFGGQTGSGKTWAMRAAAAQLARDPQNQFILCDGKWGDGLRIMQGIGGLVGPLAMDVETARRALAWAVAEMRRRYESGTRPGRLVVVIDEVQEFTQDPATAELLRRLTAQGRGAGVHVLAGTQNPLQSTFNDPTIKRNLTGRLALRVDSYKASEVVVGSNNPRADWLLGAGDSYAVVPATTQRLQVAYIPEPELDALRNDGPELDAWPDYNPEAGGTLPETKVHFDPVETGAGLVAAHLGRGRPWLREYLHALTGARPGGDKARRLLGEGRDLYHWLTAEGWTLVESELTDRRLDTH